MYTEIGLCDRRTSLIGTCKFMSLGLRYVRDLLHVTELLVDCTNAHHAFVLGM